MEKITGVGIRMKIIYEELKKGNQGLMLIWQTLDGRLQIKYYDTLTELISQFRHLVKLKLKPFINHRIKGIEWNSNKLEIFDEKERYL